MDKRHFDDIYTDIARYTAEIGCSDDALVPLLENAISDELTERVVDLQMPLDYDLVKVYREIDRQVQDYDRRMSSRTRSRRPALQTVKLQTSTTSEQLVPEGKSPPDIVAPLIRELSLNA
jgi:hypothetical protein